MPAAATIPRSRPESFLIPARWALLNQTGMGCMTWQETWLSGAGIGMILRITVRRPGLTRLARLLAQAVCRAGAHGPSPPRARGVRAATATPRGTATTTLVFVV